MAISFHGSESAGSIADKQYLTAKRETSGSIGYARNVEPEPEVKLQTLDKDTVSFKGKDNKESHTGRNVFATLAGIATAVALLGFAKKYNWLSKIPHEGIRNFIDNYMATPSHTACQWVKGADVKVFEWAKGLFKKAPESPTPPGGQI